MQFRKVPLLAALFLAGAPGYAQEVMRPPQTGAPTVFKTETRLVPVDVVVTDKKGSFVHDLEMKDFKIWEDNKEQAIKTFSSGMDPKSPLHSQKHYLVLFFDNSSMDMTDQMRARQEAGKFIDANAGPDRLIAIANYTGSLQISQNFTSDVERLKQVVAGTKMSATSTQVATVGLPRLGGMA
ncbi:MAG: VWA domain-containing protein, partial [Acidobacteriia bacterium]|nr:VWA domain-containing protein [Terriglobia bacterium]